MGGSVSFRGGSGLANCRTRTGGYANCDTRMGGAVNYDIRTGGSANYDSHPNYLAYVWPSPHADGVSSGCRENESIIQIVHHYFCISSFAGS
jgi:hypothetical protein